MVFKPGLIIGAFLWDALKNEPGVKTAGDPAKLLHPSRAGMQAFEGRSLSTPPDVAAFAKTFASRFAPGATFALRPLTEAELELFWALVPFDLEDPLFIAETAGHALLVAVDDHGLVYWLDDLAGARLEGDRLVPPPAR